MICLSASVAGMTTGGFFGYFGAQLAWSSVSLLTICALQRVPKEGGDNSSGLRSGAGGECK
jgi:hypothetical protein